MTDGSFGVIGIMLYLAFAGASICTKTITKNGGFYYQYNNLAIYFCYFLFSCTVLTCLKNILSKSKDDTKGEPVVFSKLLVQITYYFVMVGSVLALALVGNDPIINQRYQGNDLSLFFFLCMIKCFLMAHMTIHI